MTVDQEASFVLFHKYRGIEALDFVFVTDSVGIVVTVMQSALHVD
jgi:hypothetical protein